MKRLLAIAAGLAATPLGAQGASETEAAARAETVARVTQGIRQGDDLKMIEGLFGLSSAEYAELARLKGCRDDVSGAASGMKIRVNWICGSDTAVPGMARATDMIFDDGVLVGFAVNPHFADLMPLRGGMPVSSASEQKDLVEQFASMVAARQTSQLDTLVPVSDYQVSRLGYFGGGKFRVSKPRDNRVSVRFKALNGQELESYLHFDAIGYPIGLTFAPTACANCDEWVRSESQRKIDDRRKRDRRFLNSENNVRNTQRATESQINRAIRFSCPDCP